MVGRSEALFYANSIAMLVFSSFILVMMRSYFFMTTLSPRKRLLFLFPVWACWVVLLFPLFGIVAFSRTFQWTMTGVVLAFFTMYLILLNRFRLQLMRQIRALDEDEYSNEDDFPAQFARSIKWLPLVLCLILIVNFLLNDPMVKMIRDAVFTVIDVWFIIYTLNPHRKIKELPMELQKKEEEKEENPVRRRLTEEQRKNMEAKMLDLVKGENLYLKDHFTMSDLVKRMNTNKAYLSEVIALSEYGSFYQLINTLRIEHACWMLGEDPTLKMEQVALASGFSSGSAFSQVFKRIKGISPSEYLKEQR